MIGELVMLPVRVGVRATRLWLRVAEETVNVAASAAVRVIELTAPRAPGGSRGVAIPREDRATSQQDGAGAEVSRQVGSSDVEAQATAALERESSTRPGVTQTPPSQPPFPQQPSHVSESPALVEEFSEPGAEDGAGAEIHIEEPWEGYAQMNAKQIVTRLDAAAPAALAAVRLYESSHRRRQTILNAVDRRLRTANGSSRRK